MFAWFEGIDLSFVEDKWKTVFSWKMFNHRLFDYMTSGTPSKTLKRISGPFCWKKKNKRIDVCKMKLSRTGWYLYRSYMLVTDLSANRSTSLSLSVSWHKSGKSTLTIFGAQCSCCSFVMWDLPTATIMFWSVCLPPLPYKLNWVGVPRSFNGAKCSPRFGAFKGQWHLLSKRLSQVSS